MLPCLGSVYVFIREPACKTLRSLLQNQHWWGRGRRNRAKTCNFDANCFLVYCAYVLMVFPDPFADQPILASEVAFFVHFETGFRAPQSLVRSLLQNQHWWGRGSRPLRPTRNEGIQCVAAKNMRYNSCYSVKTAHLGRVTYNDPIYFYELASSTSWQPVYLRKSVLSSDLLR